MNPDGIRKQITLLAKTGCSLTSSMQNPILVEEEAPF
jgi:hypothetical protein